MITKEELTKYLIEFQAFEKAISINTEYAAAYRMLGYCQSLKKMKKEAKANYLKAKELGDTVVEQLLEKL